MARFTRERLTRTGLGLALLVAVVAVTFGAGYRTSNTLLDGASAYVQKNNTVVRANAESHHADAQAARELATGKQRLEVVQVAPGVVYVVNNETGVVSRLPTDTLQPVEAVKGDQQAAQNPPDVQAGGGRAYLFDRRRGGLTLLEGPSGPEQKPIRLPQPPSDVVVDGAGTAWVLSRSAGDLYRVADGAVVGSRHVADGWESALLTLAGDRPVVYRPQRGTATMYDRTGEVVRTVDLPPMNPRSLDGVRVAAPGADRPVLIITSKTSGELIKVDFANGRTRRVRLADPGRSRLDPPIVSHGRVYVPDRTDRRVIVLELDSLRQTLSRQVPGDTFWEFFERDGRVWVNDPYDKELLSFDRGGRPTTIDKSRDDELGEPASPRPESSRPLEHAPRPNPPSEFPRPSAPPSAPSLPSGPSGPSAPPGPAKVPETTRVPNLVGMTVEQAHRALRAAHLRWQDDVGGTVASEADVGKVYSQSPRPSARLRIGGVVTVRHLDPSGGSSVAVPNLVGQSNEDACRMLQSLSLRCAGTMAPHPSAAGVHSQDPAVGTRVPSGTPVNYAYQPVAPVPLNRYKADGTKSRYLSLGGGPVGDGPWETQPPTAAVYPPEAVGQMPGLGLVEVYESRCGNCAGQGLYYYANADDRSPAQPSGNWNGTGGAKFACFFRTSAPSGTAPLMRMFKGDGAQRRWEFAPTSSAEYSTHLSNGFAVDKDLCYVWPR